MSIEENKSIVRRLVEECWNMKNMSAIDELVASDCPHHMNGPVNFQGPEGYKNALEMWFQAFPDIQSTIEDEVAEGDKVVMRGKLKGTHQGELKFDLMPSAISPTGKKVEIEVVTINRVADGKIIETWDVANFTWIQQLNQS